MNTPYNLDKKRFATTGNEHGLSTTDTIFYYQQTGTVLTGEYRGGEILEGRFLGKFTTDDRIELLFQCVTRNFELIAGCSSGIVSRDRDGKLQLAFEWKWLIGASGGGTSSYVELPS